MTSPLSTPRRVSATLLQMTERSASRGRIWPSGPRLGDGRRGRTVSMRKVAAEVGLAPTAIYWHVGSREDLLNAVLDEMIADLPPIRARGTPRDRIASLVGRPPGVPRQRPHPAAGDRAGAGERALVPGPGRPRREMTAAGLDGDDAVAALRSILFLVGGFVMIEEEYRQREPAQVGTRHLWAGVDDEAIDPAIRAAMTGPHRHRLPLHLHAGPPPRRRPRLTPRSRSRGTRNPADVASQPAGSSVAAAAVPHRHRGHLADLRPHAAGHGDVQGHRQRGGAHRLVLRRRPLGRRRGGHRPLHVDAAPRRGRRGPGRREPGRRGGGRRDPVSGHARRRVARRREPDRL